MPGKRQKLDNSSYKNTRGIDYFFEKQRQNVPQQISSPSTIYDMDLVNKTNLTDEELARKLQAEWNKEDTSLRLQLQNSNPRHESANSDSAPSRLHSCTRNENLHNSETSREQKDVCTEKSLDIVSIEKTQFTTLSLQHTGNGDETVTSEIPFDQNPLKFNPSKYLEDLQRKFNAGEGNVSYAILTRCFVLVNNTSSRIKIVDTLVNFLRLLIEGDPSSLLPSVRIDIQNWSISFSSYSKVNPTFLRLSNSMRTRCG